MLVWGGVWVGRLVFMACMGVCGVVVGYCSGVLSLVGISVVVSVGMFGWYAVRWFCWYLSGGSRR